MTLLTVTLNAAVDKLYQVPGFVPGRVHRPAGMQVFAGGKGINVARVFRRLGGEALATGFVGGQNGEYIRQSLHSEGIPEGFVHVGAESRVCMAVIDPVSKAQTEINETGPEIVPGECQALWERLRELLPGCDSVVLAGSVPPGVQPEIYAKIIRFAREALGIRAILDTSGAALKLGAEAGPYLLKPNANELLELDVAGDGWGGSAMALRSRYRATLALITGGARGAVLASAEGIWEAAPPPIEYQSAVGSGDSLTAAFLYAQSEGNSLPEALRWGVAAGAANAATYGSGFISRDQVAGLAAQTTLNKLG